MKAKKIVTISVTAIAALMIIFSGIMKLTKNEQMVTSLSNVGVADYIVLLGLMEIAFTALFLYPRTFKIGFILLTCYFAGALATELSHGGNLFGPLMPLALVWIATFLRDSTIFLPAKNSNIFYKKNSQEVI